MQAAFEPGDAVVYSVSKISTAPGPRAEDIHPAEHGDTYSYLVPKFWRVEQRNSDGSLILVTRRGKRHTVPASDPRLRPANFWERLFYRRKFPARLNQTEPVQ